MEMPVGYWIKRGALYVSLIFDSQKPCELFAYGGVDLTARKQLKKMTRTIYTFEL